MSNVYFTSDLHLGHKLASNYRGFGDDVAAHDDAIYQSIADLNLGKRDLLWIIGDVSFYSNATLNSRAIIKLLEALNTAQLAIVLGNHDADNPFPWYSVTNKVYGAVKKYHWWITHIPIHPQEMYRAEGNVHGHIHKGTNSDTDGTPTFAEKYFNVNWDFHGRPIHMNEVKL